MDDSDIFNYDNQINFDSEAHAFVLSTANIDLVRAYCCAYVVLTNGGTEYPLFCIQKREDLFDECSPIIYNLFLDKDALQYFQRELEALQLITHTALMSGKSTYFNDIFVKNHYKRLDDKGVTYYNN